MQKFADFMDTWQGRLLRSGISYAVGIGLSHVQNNAWYVSAAPLLQTFSKWLRDKYPNSLWEVLPF